jgi:TM2 domain-containing membrane protein YozV
MTMPNETNPSGTPTPGTPAGPTIFCFACGAQIDGRAEICPRCGVRQKAAPGAGAWTGGTAGKHSRLAAALLAIFLGGFGIHKFYLGRTGQGIVYLLFFWTFIPAIVGFIEGILYLTKSDEDFAQAYG